MPDRRAALLIDLAGVLFEFDHERRLERLAEVLGRSPDDVDELLWTSGFSADCDAGRYADAAAVRAEIRRITGYRGTDDDLDAAWCSAFRPDAGVLREVARFAAGTELRLGVFTNNGPLEQQVLTRDHPEAFEHLPEHFFCHALVANKPDAAVYRQVGELLALPGEAIRFVDDSADNTAAALGCGWDAVTYTGLPDLVDLLNRLTPRH